MPYTLHRHAPGGIDSGTCRRLADLWEASVRATHRFVTDSQIGRYRTAVAAALPQLDVRILRDGADEIAFAACSGTMLEMLFVAPDRRGRGAGSALLRSVVGAGVRRVDCNEENGAALGFYLSRGFAVTGRDETDAYGYPHPILHLTLPDVP